MKRPWLAPLVPLYAGGAALRQSMATVKRLDWPVISVGNLSVGGTGKTPFTIALARLLLAQGLHVDVLSRGYGRRGAAAAMRVDAEGTSAHFGDEPLLIAHEAGVPVYVAAERWRAGRLAEREWTMSGHAQSDSTGVHLLDDGFQHRRLARDVDIVLVNSRDLADSMLPAGNLREGVSALRRATVLAVEDEDEAAVARQEALALWPQEARPPIWRYRRQMSVPQIAESLAAMPAVAFCGIGRPEQFLAGLTGRGIELAATRIFPDHHRYTRADLEALRRLAGSCGAGWLATTAKDLYRLRDLGAELDGAEPIYAIGLEVTLKNEVAILEWLRCGIGIRRKWVS